MVISVYEDMRFYDPQWFLWGMSAWRVTPARAGSYHGFWPYLLLSACCVLGDSGAWFWHIQSLFFDFKGSLVQQSLSWVVHDSGNNCEVAREKQYCCNNSLHSAGSFLPAGSEIRGRTHPRAITTIRYRRGNKNRVETQYPWSGLISTLLISLTFPKAEGKQGWKFPDVN